MDNLFLLICFLMSHLGIYLRDHCAKKSIPFRAALSLFGGKGFNIKKKKKYLKKMSPIKKYFKM